MDIQSIAKQIRDGHFSPVDLEELVSAVSDAYCFYYDDILVHMSTDLESLSSEMFSARKASEKDIEPAYEMLKDDGENFL